MITPRDMDLGSVPEAQTVDITKVHATMDAMSDLLINPTKRTVISHSKSGVDAVELVFYQKPIRELIKSLNSKEVNALFLQMAEFGWRGLRVHHNRATLVDDGRNSWMDGTEKNKTYSIFLSV